MATYTMRLERIQTSYCHITIRSGDEEEFISKAANMFTHIAADTRDNINTLEWKGLVNEINIKRAMLKEEVEEMDPILSETLEKATDDNSEEGVAHEENEKQLIQFILQTARDKTKRSQDQ